jgi:hypothetical protein
MLWRLAPWCLLIQRCVRPRSCQRGTARSAYVLPAGLTASAARLVVSADMCGNLPVSWRYIRFGWAIRYLMVTSNVLYDNI